MSGPNLVWDLGTGYDFFVSLYILHKPDEFGLRASWAAGVRSRFPADVRDVLEKAQLVVDFPMSWVHALPDMKDSATVLRSLGHLAAKERLPELAKSSGMPEKALTLLEAVAVRGAWQLVDRDSLREAYKEFKPPPQAQKLETILDIWADLETFGDNYLAALKTYRDVFFAEEEQRIQPALETAMADSKKLADQLAFDELIERVSRGIRFEEGIHVKELVLVPSFWITPLVIINELDEHRSLFLFGGRADNDSLVPGAQVPDGMLRILKTLADPTRLRILRYLSQETLSPAQLVRKLRLRAPTVTHHLSALRLAGLVYLTLGEKKRKLYAARSEAIEGTFAALAQFLIEGSEDNSEE
jgi:DNA-binding transcriptional ArsR family regulator